MSAIVVGGPPSSRGRSLVNVIVMSHTASAPQRDDELLMASRTSAGYATLMVRRRRQQWAAERDDPEGSVSDKREAYGVWRARTDRRCRLLCGVTLGDQGQMTHRVDAKATSSAAGWARGNRRSVASRTRKKTPVPSDTAVERS